MGRQYRKGVEGSVYICLPMALRRRRVRECTTHFCYGCDIHLYIGYNKMFRCVQECGCFIALSGSLRCDYIWYVL
jgi:hypothetical protein